MMTRGVLLDVDGTLLLSNDAHAAAWKEALHEEGVTISREEMRRMIGMGGDQFLPLLGLSDAEGIGKRAAARKGVLFREKFLGSLRPARGARALVTRLVAEGLTLVVATSSSEDEVHGLLRAAEVADLIVQRATSTDASRSKPQPDIVEAAVARAGLRKDDLVMLGDTPYDVSAARRAGVRIVCVRCGGWDDDSLRNAAAIYDDPQAIVDRFDESIFHAVT